MSHTFKKPKRSGKSPYMKAARMLLELAGAEGFLQFKPKRDGSAGAVFVVGPDAGPETVMAMTALQNAWRDRGGLCVNLSPKEEES